MDVHWAHTLVGSMDYRNSLELFNIHRLLTKCQVRMAGYWQVLFFFSCLWTEMELRPILT